MTFTPVDMASWPRCEQYRYFSKMAPTGWSLTTELDVTALHETVHAHGVKFYAAYLWLVTRALMRQDAFTLAEQDGVPGHYDTLTPLYAVFHEDDETFSLLWTEYSPVFRDFYAAFLRDRSLYGDVHGILAKKEPLPPANAYTVSCLPWTGFSSFAVHSFENKPYYFPSVESGRFLPRDGRLLMPLSLTLHHAATDGIHVSRFLTELQRDMDTFNPAL